MSETDNTNGLADVIRDAANNPASASTDAGSVSGHNLRDLIEAAKFLASSNAVSGKGRGIRLSKIVPPSST